MDFLLGFALVLGIVFGIAVLVLLALGTIYSMALRDLENFDDADWDVDN